MRSAPIRHRAARTYQSERSEISTSYTLNGSKPSRRGSCPLEFDSTNRQNISFVVDLADPTTLLTAQVEAGTGPALAKIVRPSKPPLANCLPLVNVTTN